MASKKGHKNTKQSERSGSKARHAPEASDNATGQASIETADEAPDPERFPIVGLGASAGGLGALEGFFEHMPTDSGMAFVVVTHQHPGQTSLMAELLGRKTEMPVVQVSTATEVEPNHVYTVRPGFKLAILNGVLQPMEADKNTPLHMPVDYFFRSLAQDQKDRAIGIVLSGTGTDGSLGLKEVKGELGMVMVQEEQSAQYGGMPHSAIATELVDYVLPVTEMPKQLLAYVGALVPGTQRAQRPEPPLEALQQIFVLIRDRTGHDFSQYKQSTVGRRIERRMNVHHLESVKRYVRFLQANPAEVDLLFKELLIGVTSFFRDPEAWDALSSSLSELLADKPDDYVVRAWVPGCSTGEEAYSLAILLRESMDALKRTLSVQIFATDLDGAAIDVARAGAYPIGVANDLTPKRLARFFTQEDDTYRVKKEIREMLVFAPQNLIADPPFTKLDLLSCRNLLIYLDAGLQKRLLPIFHYSLKQNGLLFLGSSESIGSFLELFSTVDKKWKIFRRNEVVSGKYIAEFPAAMPDLTAGGTTQPTGNLRASGAVHIDQIVDKMILRELTPPMVLVHERGDVVHVHGRTGLFLEPAQGAQASANIFNMARQGLQMSLTSTIRQAAQSDKEIVQRGIHVKTNGDAVFVDIHVRRLREPEPLRGLFRITFHHVRPVAREHESSIEDDDAAKPPNRISELERELQYTKESHQGTIEELETANEELKSTNEELQSTNEELQSANEELETSKEEMQSLNEELQTVNAELQGKVDELSRANNDMKNLLNATDIATVFLDNELCIKRYTEQAKNVIRLIPSDVGRPIGDLVSSLHYDRLVDDAREVLRTLVFKEIAVQGEDHANYLIRILPYRTTDNVIEGLVLTFVDVTKIKSLQEEQARLLDVLHDSPASVFGQDRDLRFTWSCSSVFGKSPAELIGKSDREIFERDDAERLGKLKKNVLATGAAARHQVDLAVGGARRTYDLYMAPKHDPAGQLVGLSCLAMDITQRQ